MLNHKDYNRKFYDKRCAHKRKRSISRNKYTTCTHVQLSRKDKKHYKKIVRQEKQRFLELIKPNYIYYRNFYKFKIPDLKKVPQWSDATFRECVFGYELGTSQDWNYKLNILRNDIRNKLYFASWAYIGQHAKKYAYHIDAVWQFEIDVVVYLAYNQEYDSYHVFKIRFTCFKVCENDNDNDNEYNDDEDGNCNDKYNDGHMHGGKGKKQLQCLIDGSFDIDKKYEQSDSIYHYHFDLYCPGVCIDIDSLDGPIDDIYYFYKYKKNDLMLQRMNDFFRLIKKYFNKIVSDEWKKKYQLLKEITISPLWCLKEYNFINSENIVDDDDYYYPDVVNSKINSNIDDNDDKRKIEKRRKNIEDIKFGDIIENETTLCQILFEYEIVFPKVIINIICIDYVGYDLFGTINVCGKWEYRSATDDPYPINKQMNQYTNCFISPNGNCHWDDAENDDCKASNATESRQDNDIDSDNNSVDDNGDLSVEAMKKYRFIH